LTTISLQVSSKGHLTRHTVCSLSVKKEPLLPTGANITSTLNGTGRKMLPKQKKFRLLRDRNRTGSMSTISSIALKQEKNRPARLKLEERPQFTCILPTFLQEWGNLFCCGMMPT